MTVENGVYCESLTNSELYKYNIEFTNQWQGLISSAQDQKLGHRKIFPTS